MGLGEVTGTEWSFVKHPVLVSCEHELADILQSAWRDSETHFLEILLFLGVEVPKDLKNTNKRPS